MNGPLICLGCEGKMSDTKVVWKLTTYAETSQERASGMSRSAMNDVRLQRQHKLSVLDWCGLQGMAYMADGHAQRF